MQRQQLQLNRRIACICFIAIVTGCVAPSPPPRDSRHDWSAQPLRACVADAHLEQESPTGGSYRLYAPPGAKVTVSALGSKEYYFDGRDEHGQVIEELGHFPQVTACTVYPLLPEFRTVTIKAEPTVVRFSIAPFPPNSSPANPNDLGVCHYKITKDRKGVWHVAVDITNLEFSPPENFHTTGVLFVWVSSTEDEDGPYGSHELQVSMRSDYVRALTDDEVRRDLNVPKRKIDKVTEFSCHAFR